MKTKHTIKLRSDFRLFGVLFLFCFHIIQGQIYISEGAFIYTEDENIFQDSIKNDKNTNNKIYITPNTTIVNFQSLDNIEIVEVKDEKTSIAFSEKNNKEKIQNKEIEKEENTKVEVEIYSAEKEFFSSFPSPFQILSSSKARPLAIISLSKNNISGFTALPKNSIKKIILSDKRLRTIFKHNFFIYEINFSSFSVRPPPFC